MISEFPEKLTEDLYFNLMSELGANPKWATSNGKRVLLLTGLCHHSRSGHHSVIFDCSHEGEQKITCMSSCGDTRYWWNYLARVLQLDSKDTRDWVVDWLNGKQVQENMLQRLDFSYIPEGEAEFSSTPLEMVPGIGEDVERDIYKHFETSEDILSECVWHKEDKIDINILQLYDVAIYPERDTIILPHHNINGEIVGIYERNFNMLRSKAKKLYPEMPYRMLLEYPRAKYVPLVKEWQYQLGPDEKGKTSWSFPNARNLYGLHLAKDKILETGEVIIFEGAKSVMLARQFGYDNGVASHTFGANENHIAMLLEAGATDIYLAFDKQYLDDDDALSREFSLYEKKTRGLGKRIKDYCNVYRIRDWDEDLDYKDSPVDKGEEIFDKLKANAEPLFVFGEEQHYKRERQTLGEKLLILKKKQKKLKRLEQESDQITQNSKPAITEEQLELFEELERMLNNS